MLGNSSILSLTKPTYTATTLENHWGHQKVHGSRAVDGRSLHVPGFRRFRILKFIGGVNLGLLWHRAPRSSSSLKKQNACFVKIFDLNETFRKISRIEFVRLSCGRTQLQSLLTSAGQARTAVLPTRRAAPAARQCTPDASRILPRDLIVLKPIPGSPCNCKPHPLRAGEAIQTRDEA